MNASNTRERAPALLLAAATLVFLIAVPAWHFHDRPYRQDEAWVVHYALENIENVGLPQHILQVFSQLLPENALQDIWLHLFGHDENVLRYFSRLTTLFALSLFYRLAADLYDRHTAWLALGILGSYSVYVYYSGEARPYAALVMGAVGFQWALLRFIRLPNLPRAVLAIALAALPFYLHPFILYVIIAQVICSLVFLRRDRALYRHGLALFAMLALLIASRAWLNFADRSGTIGYSIETSWQGLAELYDHFRFNPEALGLLLLLGSLALFLGACWRSIFAPRPAGNARNVPYESPMAIALGERMRSPRLWHEGWLLLSLLIIVCLPLLVNAFVPSLTPRNLLIAAPYLALLAVVSLRQMPRGVQLLSLLFFFAPFVAQFRSHHANAGYPELAAELERHYQPDRDRLVVIAAQAWEWIAINYYLLERAEIGFGADDIFYVSWEGQDKDSFGPLTIDPSLTVSGFSAGDWRRLQAFLGERDRLWVIKGFPFHGGDRMLSAIDAAYTLYRAVDFPGESYYLALELLQYQRRPADQEPLWRYGDRFNLLDWRLLDAVDAQPCQEIAVESWWSTSAAGDGLYSATLVIADENGQGLANADGVPGGVYLTSVWRADQPYYDRRSLQVPCDIAAGRYPLLLGLYPLETVAGAAADNLPVLSADGDATGQRLLYLTTLTVER